MFPVLPPSVINVLHSKYVSCFQIPASLHAVLKYDSIGDQYNLSFRSSVKVMKTISIYSAKLKRFKNAVSDQLTGENLQIIRG